MNATSNIIELPAAVEFEGMQIPLTNPEFILSHVMQGLRIRYQRCSAEDKTEAERQASRRELLDRLSKGEIPQTGARGKPADFQHQAEKLELIEWFLQEVFTTGKMANRRESCENATKNLPSAWETVTRRFLIAALQASGKNEQQIKDLAVEFPAKIAANLPAVKAKFAAKIASRKQKLEDAAKAKKIKQQEEKTVLDVSGLDW
jgi:hypothetical protein